MPVNFLSKEIRKSNPSMIARLISLEEIKRLVSIFAAFCDR
ncbi:MAG: hypothetical protein AAF915_09205 [Cyanobacteria bacterium P01_D01_bin.50]